MNSETNEAAVEKIRRQARASKPKRPKLSLAERRLFGKLQQRPGIAFGKRDRSNVLARRLEAKGYVTNRSGHWYPNFYGKVS